MMPFEIRSAVASHRVDVAPSALVALADMVSVYLAAEQTLRGALANGMQPHDTAYAKLVNEAVTSLLALRQAVARDYDMPSSGIPQPERDHLDLVEVIGNLPSLQVGKSCAQGSQKKRRWWQRVWRRLLHSFQDS